MDRWTTFRSCDRAREAISRALDDELSPFEARLLAAHLTACPACREFESDAASATSELRRAPLELLERPVTLPRRRSVRPLHGSAAAALAAAAVLVLSVASPVEFDGGQDARLAAPASQPEPRIVEDGEPFPADHVRQTPRPGEDVALPE